MFYFYLTSRKDSLYLKIQVESRLFEIFQQRSRLSAYSLLTPLFHPFRSPDSDNLTGKDSFEYEGRRTVTERRIIGMMNSTYKVSKSKKKPIKQPLLNSKCKSLILLDSNKIKQDEQEKCKTTYNKIDYLKKIIELHESQNVKQYEQWLNSKFGAQLTDIRSLESTVQELMHTVEAIEQLRFCSGMSAQEAYKTVTMMKNEMKEFEANFHKQRDDFNNLNEEEAYKKFREQQDEAQEFFKKSENEFKETILRGAFESIYGTKKQWRSKTETYEEAFEEFKTEAEEENLDGDSDEDDFEDIFGSDEDDFEDIFGFNSKRQKEQNKHKEQPAFFSFEQQEEQNEALRLKDLYRSLARQLHPDVNHNSDPKKLDLWYQVQAAYEANDLSKLEVLSALSNMLDQSWNKIDTVSMLKKLANELKKTLSQLDKKINFIKKSPSWDFTKKQSNTKKMIAFEEKTRLKFTTELSNLSMKQKDLQAQLDLWSKPARPSCIGYHGIGERLSNLREFPVC